MRPREGRFLINQNCKFDLKGVGLLSAKPMGTFIVKNIVTALLVALIVSGCSSAPKPKQPDESNRQPINKTMPAEVQGAIK
ncbi:MAG: hypothetical protein ACK5NQ_11525 [Pseudomonas sp.]